MGTGATELSLTDLAALGTYNNVIFFNDPSDTDLIKTIAGSPRTILINLGQFLNIATGEIQGDALAADELLAAQLGPNSVGTSELGPNVVTPAEVEVDLVQYASVQLTDAQMLALLGTDVTLVAAPGANRAIVVDSIYMFFDSTTAYTIGTAVLAAGYGGDNADVVGLTEVGFVDQATDQARIEQPTGVLTPTANQPIVLRATVADLTGGNAANTFSVRVTYHVVDVAAFT